MLCGSQNIVLNGKNIVQSEAIIRGDLANVRVGRHCIISSKAVIRPPFKKFSKGYVSPSHPSGVTKPSSLKLAISGITFTSIAQKGKS